MDLPLPSWSKPTGEKNGTRVAHTLTACGRCRSRKTRCDPGLPRCGPCEKTNAPCEYWDQAKGKMIPRHYVVHLQDRVRSLEAKLAQLERDRPSPPEPEPEPEGIVRGAGLVRFDEGVEPRFLGSSSGIAMSRLVLELAKNNMGTKSIRDLVPDDGPTPHKVKSPTDGSEVKAYPILSSVPALSLPSRPTADKLVEVFCQRSQFLLPTLHEPSFRADVQAVYDGSKDPYRNFVLRMVFAISLQKLDAQYAGLADSYYLAAFEYVDAAMRSMDLKTLQCLVLIGQYSLLTPTRTAVYYVIGLASKLCQQLGLHEEDIFVQTGVEYKLDALEKDMRRRLFWIVISMEYGLSHSLGRPSALSIGPDHIDVGYFASVDDELITPDAVLHGPASPKKLIAIHFFEMRLLQAEIRRKLYQKKRDEPKDDQDPWFAEMEAKVDHWRSSSPYNAEGSGHSNAWFTSKYNTIIVQLFRSSPQIPNPSVRAAVLCFNASAYNARMQRRQIAERSVDTTWILVQSLFMALNTILWCISYPEVRRLNPKSELVQLLQLGLESIRLCSDRWPGASSAYELYIKLSQARLKSYDTIENTNGTSTPSTLASPASLLPTSIQSSKSSPASQQRTFVTSPPDQTSPASIFLDPTSPHEWTSPNFTSSSPSPNYLNAFRDIPLTAEPATNLLPATSAWDPLYTTLPAITNLPFGPSTELLNPALLANSPHDQYMQMMYGVPDSTAFSRRQDSLSQAQQRELMDTLETDGVEHMSTLLDQSKNFFNSLGTP
ncbi:MAG: hypothetical protein M1838_003412 [Thelocarpon superellum]|nr:MAG: hypothetical protein M1838_003412 [Thelocarpon superellum]